MAQVAQGLARSATLRDLEAHLQGRQVIVYLSRSFLPPEVKGRTLLIGVGGSWRYLSVELDSRLSPMDWMATLGHELQHVIEIVDDGKVTDTRSLLALYRRIGSERTDSVSVSHSFETTAAIEIGLRVYGEVCTGGW
jgi:hypothetical protein